MADDDAVKVLGKEERFPENGTYVDVTAYRVPTSDRYPEGIKYSTQYGHEGGDTIFRYDNFPDHPDAAVHHRHNSDGTVSDVEFEGSDLSISDSRTRYPNMKTGDTTDDARVMHVRFGEGNEQRVEETLKALDRGEDPEPYFEVVFRDVDELHRVTRPKNLELLRTIARDEPESIRETARLVDRDVRQVHDNLQELEDLGLIEFEQAGGSKKPVVWYDEISVEVSLLEDESDTDEPATA